MAAPEFEQHGFAAGALHLGALAGTRGAGWAAEACADHRYLILATEAAGDAGGTSPMPAAEVVRRLRAVLLAGDPQATPAAESAAPEAIERLLRVLGNAPPAAALQAAGAARNRRGTVLIALATERRIWIVACGDGARLMRLGADDTVVAITGEGEGGEGGEGVSSESSESSEEPGAAHGAGISRQVVAAGEPPITVSSAPLVAGDLVYAVPAAAEPEGAEEALLANLSRWPLLGPDRDPCELAEAFGAEALPQAYAGLLAASPGAGVEPPFAGGDAPSRAGEADRHDQDQQAFRPAHDGECVPAEPDSAGWSTLMEAARAAVGDADWADGAVPPPPPANAAAVDAAAARAPASGAAAEPPPLPRWTFDELEPEPVAPPAGAAFEAERAAPPAPQEPEPESGRAAPAPEPDGVSQLDGISEPFDIPELRLGATAARPARPWTIAREAAASSAGWRAAGEEESNGGTALVRLPPAYAAAAVHPWVARRQRRNQPRSVLPWLVAAAILSAMLGTLALLGSSGGPDRRAGEQPGGWRAWGLQAARSVLTSGAHQRSGDRALPVLDAPVGVPVRSLPAGAEVLVDGQTTGLTTPLASLALEPGTHTIELKLADFGAWQGEVTISPGGGGMDGIDVALTGTVSAYTDKLLPGVEVELDGQPLAEAPVVTGDVAAGMHVVRFRGPGGYTWEEEVPVRVGETAEVVAPLGAAESLGLVTIRGFTVGSTGKSFAGGDPIRVDGDAHGATPAELYLVGGRHSIELEHEGRTLRRIVKVRAGDRRFIDLRIDRLPAISIEHAAPATVEVSSNPLITAMLHGQGAERRRPVFLQVELEGSWTRLAMGQVPGAASTYVVGLPVTSNLAGETLRYYFTTTDPAGRTADSAIYSVVLR